MVGLIVKGSTALFLEGLDPGPEAAVSVVNRHKMQNMRSFATRLRELKLEQIPRPVPLSRQGLTWAYVLVILTEEDQRRLEPGPFDTELAGVVRDIEAEHVDDHRA